MALRLAAVLWGLMLIVAACSNAGGANSDGAVGSSEGAESSEGAREVTSTTAAVPPTTEAQTTTTSATQTTEDNEATANDGESSPAIGGELSFEPDPRAIPLAPVAPGDSGDDVLALQERLAVYGFGPGNPDASYGGRTERAVEAFQEIVGIEPSGVADAETTAALSTYTYDGLIVRSGESGPTVEELQTRLKEGPFDPGPIDGEYGTATVQAVWALEKLSGVPVDGDWGPLDEAAWSDLTEGRIGRPVEEHDLRWVEVDLSTQLVKVYDPGSTTPVLISHASSGSGVPWENEEYSGRSITPVGDFEITRRISGWRESSLNIGSLYNPLYFNGGIAFHGATSVPLYPASHGCVRLPMHIADYLPGELPNGTPVHVMS